MLQADALCSTSLVNPERTQQAKTVLLEEGRQAVAASGRPSSGRRTRRTAAFTHYVSGGWLPLTPGSYRSFPQLDNVPLPEERRAVMARPARAYAAMDSRVATAAAAVTEAPW